MNLKETVDNFIIEICKSLKIDKITYKLNCILKRIFKREGICDRFGRLWILSPKELCKTCGQPDNCGECNHKKLSNKDVKILKGDKK